MDPDPFIMITLYGCFKGKTRFRWHCLPVCDHNQSGVPFRKRIDRLLRHRVTVQKRNSGWLFKKRNRCANLSLRDLDELFVHYITEVHRLYPSLFSVGTIMVMFSTWRLMCKGSILETAG